MKEMRRGVIVGVLILLYVSFVSAGLEDAISLRLDTELIFSVSADEQVRNLTANLTFFPREGINQKVSLLELSADPNADIWQASESIFIKWIDPVSDAEFRIKSEIEKSVNEGNRIANNENKFLSSTKFINSNDAEIKKLALSVAGEGSSLEKVMKIGRWVQENINYDLSSLNVAASLSAVEVLEKRAGVCDEMTILFLAMVRSLDIPGRYVSGLVYSEAFKERWIPHAWAEVYINGKWIPIDVTFGQFGWVDPTHIKMKEGSDVDYSSIVYRWYDAKKIKPHQPIAKVKVLEEILEERPASIEEIIPLAREVDFGSVVPVEVIVKNKNADPLFERLSLKKAPAGLGVRDIPVWLDANEERSYFFLVKIPEEGDNEFLTVIEVKDRSGKKSASEIKFGKKFGKISLEKAEFLIRKSEFEKLNAKIKCETRSLEKKQEVECGVEGADEGCFENECKLIKEGRLLFERKELKEGEDKVLIKKEDKLISVPVWFEQSELKVVQVKCPQRLNADESGRISLILRSNDFVENAYLLIEGLEPFKLKDFKGTQLVTLPIRGNYFIADSGEVKFKIAYDNLEGERSEVNANCQLEVDAGLFQKVKAYVRRVLED